jgi:hypothetical protein
VALIKMRFIRMGLDWRSTVRKSERRAQTGAGRRRTHGFAAGKDGDDHVVRSSNQTGAHE